jgi:hypothetical protein
MNQQDIILTGLPRSGTTLSCFLLNKLPDTVALHEPMEVHEFPKLPSPTAIIDRIGTFFQQTRQTLLQSHHALSKHRDGAIPDNPIAPQAPAEGLRPSAVLRGEVTIDKPLSKDFTLIIKHPSAFTALLPVLREQFPCFALIRNPLSVLSSWSSVVFPIHDGHAPAAENLTPELQQALAAIPDVISRQLHLLSWFYEQYARYLSPRQMIRYEEMIETRGRALAPISPPAAELSEPLQSRNNNKLYDPELKQRHAEALLRSDGYYWKFYSREDVQRLLQAEVTA